MVSLLSLFWIWKTVEKKNSVKIDKTGLKARWKKVGRDVMQAGEVSRTGLRYEA